MSKKGIIIEHFQSRHLFLDEQLYLDNELKDTIGDDLIQELNTEAWRTLSELELLNLSNKLKELVGKKLDFAVETYKESLSGNFQIDFMNKSYQVNLRSNEGRKAKFILKLFYIFKANYYSGYAVKLRLGDSDLYESLRKK